MGFSRNSKSTGIGFWMIHFLQTNELASKPRLCPFFCAALRKDLLTVNHECFGSMYVSGKLPTYPSPNLTFCPKREVNVNVSFGDGWVGSFAETFIDRFST